MTFQTIKQGATLTAKSGFQFKAAGARGKPVTVKPGQRFWVTNCGTDQQRSQMIVIDREGRGVISHGYAFAPNTIEQLFEVAA